MELLLTRISTGVESTLGMLHDVTFEPLFQCYVLEDQYQENKIPSETRIPPGRYQIKMRDEGGMVHRYKRRFPWHEGMLHLQDVPNFTYIYLHVGNDDDDTDGCLLVGDGQASNITGMGTITSSVNAYSRLYDRIITALRSGEVWIEIKDFA